MNVLMITGDKNFGPGHPRFELQKSSVDALSVMYFGRGGMFPRIPAGKFDVVTVQDPFWRGLFAWHVARRLRAKLNIQVHADLKGQSFIKHVLAQIVLRHAGSVRVVSEKLKQQVEQFGVHVPITVLPVFVDIERFTKVMRQPDGKTILWIGRFEVEKDPLYALEVLKKVSGAKLVMLGKGSLEAKLRAHAKGLPVEFEGWEDPAPYLVRASVVLCTSRFESWGASIVEALAAGVPVVAPDVGVAREAGAIVVPRAELAQAIVRVLQAGTRGELKLNLLDAQPWARAWRDSL